MKKIIFLFCLIAIARHSSAQAIFISKGKIEFEKRTNMWISMTGSFAEQLKKTLPEYKTSYFNYEFDAKKAIYKPGREVDDKYNSFFGNLAGDNVVYSDFTTDKYVAKKHVFEKTFLIEDSLRNAKWKIKNDFRDIAGFHCRRATTIIMDSVFVVAFYTDEITIPGGPESFSGLPGMILGLVINRIHTTWYATKVEAESVDEKDLTPPNGGKKIDESTLKEELKKLMSDWGKYGQRNLWNIMI
ncbi:MAG: GLPGLI family protein [Ginsengibacter sp.]